jgi:hypothetical protein
MREAGGFDMNSDRTFGRIAGISAMVAAPIAVLSLVLAFLAVEFNADFNPGDLIALGTRGATIFRTAWMATDAFGFALLLTPAILYLRHWLEVKSPDLVALCTVFGLAYVFTEVVALSIIGGAVPPMMSAYSEAVGPQRDQLMLVFDAVINMVFNGISAFATTFLGIWWLGIGSVLRTERRWLGVLTMVLGAEALVWGIGRILGFGNNPVVETLELPYLLSWPFWILWLGIVLLRRVSGGDQLPEVPARAAA